MKITDLYSPTIDGHAYSGFILACNTIRNIDGRWVDGIDLQTLDKRVKKDIGDKLVLPLFDKIDLATYRDISDILSSHQYTLDKMFDTLSLVYDPIQNYDSTETHTGNDKTSHGQQKQITEYGADTTNMAHGATSGTQTNTSQVAPYDADFVNDNKDSNTVTTEAYNDSTTRQQHSDSNTADAYDDTVTYNTTIRRFGNIGVTTSQQMIASEREDVAMYDFYTTIIDILNDELTCPFWSEM